MKAPTAKKILKTLISHGDKRVDPYFWMNQRGGRDVLSLIKREQKYFKLMTASSKKLRAKLLKEMKKRIPGKDQSVPYREGEYSYFTRWASKKEYPIYCRRKIGQKKIEVILDVNKLSRGKKYCDMSELAVSPSKEKLAFCVDEEGRRFYSIFFKNLKSGCLLSQKIKNTAGDIVWAGDNNTLFYVQQDPKTLRSCRVFRYNLKTRKRKLIYEEKDESFSVSLYKTLSKKFIFIQSSSTLTSESRYIPADKPLEKFKIFQKRKRGLEYYVNDGKSVFYILTNSKKHANFRLDKTPLNKTSLKNWKTLLRHDKAVYLEDFEVFEDFIALECRKNGLSEILVFDRKTKKKFFIPMKSKCCSVFLGVNAEYKANKIRFEYESMVCPKNTYDYHVKNGRKTLIYRKKPPLGFSPSRYRSQRITAVSSKDKVKIPISLIYRKDKFCKSSNPLFLYGYGAYGYSMEPGFYSHIFSLVDRGFVFAAAHVRGGAEMGQSWYENGRRLKKKNTFYDFIDCSELLIKKGFSHKEKLYAAGGSAGGLLIGSVLNMRPDLYRALTAHVPFVDVLTTMLDPSIPLTTGEYDEWGNPENKKYYDYIKSYSPYDNIKAGEFPYLLITSGYHDSQVQYWEPLKWTARLREFQRAKRPILLNMDMDSGHSGATGRFNRLNLLAVEYAFFLSLEGFK